MQRRREALIGWLLLTAALVAVVTIGVIVAVLVGESLPFFQTVPLAEFLGSGQWTPLFDPPHFGIWPLVAGTVLVTVIAVAVALVLGLGSAIYLAEYASARTRLLTKPVLELLAGVPTIIYGYFALTTVTPLLAELIPGLDVFNALSAGLVMGIMILPLITSLAEDAMAAVPQSLRDAAYALGATRLEVILRVVLPAALSGIAAALILAISRAVGETMLVTIAAGATPRLTLDPRESIQTMTAYIAQVSLGETPHGTLEYQTIFAVGLVLFLATLTLNLMSQRLVARWQLREHG